MKLGLPLLASIYEYGFQHGIRWADQELSGALMEIDQLERYWIAKIPDSDRLDILKERAGYLKEAITIARAHEAVVTII